MPHSTVPVVALKLNWGRRWNAKSRSLRRTQDALMLQSVNTAVMMAPHDGDVQKSCHQIRLYCFRLDLSVSD